MPYPPPLPPPAATARVPSPCVRNCCLDERDVCLGCGRTLEEIRIWSEADDDRRRGILEQAAQRRADRALRQRSAWQDPDRSR